MPEYRNKAFISYAKFKLIIIWNSIISFIAEVSIYFIFPYYNKKNKALSKIPSRTYLTSFCQ